MPTADSEFTTRPFTRALFPVEVVIVKFAVARLETSAEDVAVTVAKPVLDGAVYVAVFAPVAVIVPRFVVHVTEVFPVPVTVAEKFRVPLAPTLAVAGLTEIPILETEITHVAARSGFASERAVTMKVPLVPGAVNVAVAAPVGEMVPPVVDHVTVGLLEPVTSAVRATVSLIAGEAEEGEMETVTPPPPAPPPPPQAQMAKRTRIAGIHFNFMVSSIRTPYGAGGFALFRCKGTLSVPIRRGVAQFGSAPALGAGGRGFESRRPDHFISYSGDPLLHGSDPWIRKSRNTMQIGQVIFSIHNYNAVGKKFVNLFF